MRLFLFIVVVWSFIVTSAIAQSPALTETLTFAPIPVGARRELRLRIQDLPSGGYYQVVQSPRAPFTLTSEPKDLVVSGDDIEIRVEFAPQTVGDFQDEIKLQRTPATGQNIVDQIRIRLFATAFRIERTDDLDFGKVMTGDTVTKTVLYRAGRNDEFNFEYAGELSEPFYMVTAQGPIRRGFDTLAVIVGFSPTTAGKFSDTIGVVRRDLSGRRLDTAFIVLEGIGRAMPVEKTVDLRDLVAGDYASRQVVVILPEKIVTTSFTYSVEARSAAPYTSVSITAPSGPSTSQQITLNVIANPRNKVDQRSTYMLLRKDPSGRAIDSTRIVLDVAASSRPVAWSASFGADAIVARIGDTLTLELRARTSDPIDEPTQIQSIKYSLSYNPSVFVPLLASNQVLSVVDDKQVLTTTIDAFAEPPVIGADGDVITTLRAVVALGDAESTVLDVSDVSCTDVRGVPLAMTGSSTMLQISNAWRYATGGVRLVNTLQGTLTLDVDPNPVVGISTLRIRNLPQGAGQVTIVDELGQIRADLTQDVRAGKRDFTVASSGAADVIVGPGRYYARCVVESILGNTLSSIVRLFVVQ